MNTELIKQLQNIDNLNAARLAEVLNKKSVELQREKKNLSRVEQKIEITIKEQAALEEIASRWLENGDYEAIPDVVCRHHSEEHKRKISMAMKGRKLPESTKLRMRENSCRMTVYQYTVEGEFVRAWKSTRDVMRKLGYNSTSISRCCRGLQKTCHGYVWKYVPIEDAVPMVELKITETYTT